MAGGRFGCLEKPSSIAKRRNNFLCLFYRLHPASDPAKDIADLFQIVAGTLTVATNFNFKRGLKYRNEILQCVAYVMCSNPRPKVLCAAVNVAENLFNDVYLPTNVRHEN